MADVTGEWMEWFWKVYMVVNGLAIFVFAATLVWAAFDLHKRLPYVMFAQIPPILMLGIRRIFR